MALVHLVMALMLIEFLAFGWQVGRARGRYNVPAPATSGHEVFERYFRAHMNTLEQLVVVLPSMLIFAVYWGPLAAAALGLLFIVGRAMYFLGYTRAAAQRHVGFLVGSIPTVILLVGALLGALRALLLH
jgi:glutathione S-transferase